MVIDDAQLDSELLAVMDSIIISCLLDHFSLTNSWIKIWRGSSMIYYLFSLLTNAWRRNVWKIDKCVKLEQSSSIVFKILFSSFYFCQRYRRWKFGNNSRCYLISSTFFSPFFQVCEFEHKEKKKRKSGAIDLKKKNKSRWEMKIYSTLWPLSFRVSIHELKQHNQLLIYFVILNNIDTEKTPMHWKRKLNFNHYVNWYYRWRIL